MAPLPCCAAQRRPVRYALARTPRGPRKTFGRYDFTGAREPRGGRGKPARSVHVRTATVAVDDPGELLRSESGRLVLRQEPSGRLLVNVNRRVDLLEHERAHGRISDAAYGIGRLVQAVFERYRGPGCGSQWREGDHVDADLAHELAIIYGLENAEAVRKLVAKIRREIGRIDANIVQRLLAQRQSFAQVGQLIGRGGERGSAYIAQRFRDALEALSETFAARGKGKPRLLDKHDLAAARVDRRRGRWPDALEDAVEAHRKLREAEREDEDD